MSLSGTSGNISAQCSIAAVSPTECNTGPALSLSCPGLHIQARSWNSEVCVKLSGDALSDSVMQKSVLRKWETFSPEFTL